MSVGDNHVFEVTAVIARRNALLHALVCESPEDLRLLELARGDAHLPGTAGGQAARRDRRVVHALRHEHGGENAAAVRRPRPAGAAVGEGANHDWNKTAFVVDEVVDIDNFDDVWWAYLTRALVIPDVAGFYRDPKKDLWGRLAIDAAAPFGRREEFIRKRIPGADSVDLKRHFG